MHRNGQKNYFITLEGIEGAGKSTQAKFIAERLQSKDHDVVLTREPGGTVVGENIRNILLDKKRMAMSADTELLLFYAARAQHAKEVLMPSLMAGKTVICDRFNDSSLAYQGGGRGIEHHKIKALEALLFSGAMADIKPDLTLLFDVPAAAGLSRSGTMITQDMFSPNEDDRFEVETIEFFQRVRNAFLQIAAGEPDRVCVIDATRNQRTVQSSILKILKARNIGDG